MLFPNLAIIAGNIRFVLF